MGRSAESLVPLRHNFNRHAALEVGRVLLPVLELGLLGIDERLHERLILLLVEQAVDIVLPALVPACGHPTGVHVYAVAVDDGFSEPRFSERAGRDDCRVIWERVEPFPNDLDILWFVMAFVTSAANSSRSTTTAEPAGTQWASAACMISEPRARVTAVERHCRCRHRRAWQQSGVEMESALAGTRSGILRCRTGKLIGAADRARLDAREYRQKQTKG